MSQYRLVADLLAPRESVFNQSHLIPSPLNSSLLLHLAPRRSQRLSPFFSHRSTHSGPDTSLGDSTQRQSWLHNISTDAESSNRAKRRWPSSSSPAKSPPTYKIRYCYANFQNPDRSSGYRRVVLNKQPSGHGSGQSVSTGIRHTSREHERDPARPGNRIVRDAASSKGRSPLHPKTVSRFGQTKYISVMDIDAKGRCKSCSFSPRWNTACARLHQSFGPNAQKGGRSDRAGTDILPTDLPGLQDWADSLLSVDAAEDVVRQAWPRLEEGDRQQRWDYFMMRTLQHYPSQGLKVLKATYTSPLPPAPRVGDVLQFLCGYHLLDGDLRSRRKVTDKLLETIYFVLTQGNGRLAEIDQKTIYLLFTRLNLERAHRLYEKLGHHGMSVRPHTLLHLIDLTAKSGSSGAVARASQLLDDVLAKEDSPLVSSQILAVSSTILSKLGTSAEGHDLHPQILASLVSRGVQPDITLVNNVLRSTLSAGNPEIGWRIYDMLGQYGMKADRYTFSILINDAKRRRDWEALERIVRTAREQGLALDEHLVNDLIHAASQSANTVTNTKADAALPTRSRRAVRAEQRKALRACWGTTLEYYRSFYSLQPLYDLGVLHHKNNPTVSSSTADSRSDSSPSTTPKPMPPAPTLNLILSNYIITRRSLEGIKRVYCRYRALASGRHEHLVALYESDWVSHAFITAFSRREETLPLCAEILDDMLKASGGNPPRTGHNAPTRTRGPTIKTLLILLRTYTDPPPYHPTPKPSSLTSPTSATPLTDAKLIRTLPSASHLAKAESILSLLTNMDPPSPPSSSSSFSSSPPQTFHPTPHDLQRAYNLLLAGYVRVRDRPGAMSVLRRMEGHGLGGDKGTVAILTRSGEGAEVVRLMREGGRGFGWGGGGLKFDEMGWDGGKDGTVMALLERNSS